MRAFLRTRHVSRFNIRARTHTHTPTKSRKREIEVDLRAMPATGALPLAAPQATASFAEAEGRTIFGDNGSAVVSREGCPLRAIPLCCFRRITHLLSVFALMFSKRTFE